MLQSSLLAFFLIIGATFVSGSNADDFEALGNNLAENLPELPINVSQVPTKEEAEKLLREKCLKNGGEGAFERAQGAKDEMQVCAQSLVNVTELQKEMELASPHGELDSVFQKYCKKSPKLLGCINNFTMAIEPCMEEKEKESKRIVQNITEAMLNFICYKEGDRIALFISEGGLDCLQLKQEEIKTCANNTIGKLVPAAEVNSLETLPMLVLEEKECGSISDLQKCVVSSLETCSEPTPANIVESLFKFIIKMTPCEKILKNRSASSDNLVGDLGGSGSRIKSVLGMTAVLLIGTRLLV